MNHLTWASRIGLYLSGLDCKSHLTTTVESVTIEHHEQWIEIDGQLYSIIKSTLHTSLKPIFRLMRRVHQFRVRPVPFIPMTDNICITYVYLS